MNKIFTKIMSYCFVFLLGCYVGRDLVGAQEVDWFSWMGTIFLSIYFIVEANKK